MRRRASSAPSTWPAKRVSVPAARASSAARCGPSPATTSGRPAAAQAAIATSMPFSGASRDDDERVAPVRGRRALGELAHDVADDVHRPDERRAELLQALVRGGARHDDGVGLLDEPPLPERERRAVDDRLLAGAAAVQAHAGERVAPVAARAVLAVGEARPDGADEPVVVEVQDRPRAGGAGGCERAPAERRVEVVGVDGAGARAADRVGDLLGAQAAAEQAGRGAGAPDPGAVAREQLGVLVEVLAHEPHEVLDGALLAAGRAVAVVEEEDHESCRRRTIRAERAATVCQT